MTLAVWGSTRGTLRPPHWFLQWAEWLVLRSYRGWLLAERI